MSSGKQHVDIRRKLALRRELLPLAEPGAVYLPYCGDGDIAAELYPDRALFAIDLDPDRITTISQRLGQGHEKSRFLASTAESWPGADAATFTYAIGDFDAYSDPYASFRAFWPEARKTGRMVLFFTDGHRQGIMRTKNFHAPDGSKHKLATANDARKLFNAYWSKIIEPWFIEYVKPWRVVRSMKYLRGMMIYWGAVIEAPAGGGAGKRKAVAPAKPPARKPAKRTAARKLDPADEALGRDGKEDGDWTDEELGLNPLKVGKFGPHKKRLFLKALVDGGTRSEAARIAGVTLRTVEKHVHLFPHFKEAIDLAETDANGKVENALFQAAISGNVTAIQVWLYNRDPDRWKDKRAPAVKIDIADKVREMARNAGLTDEDTEAAVQEAMSLTRGQG